MAAIYLIGLYTNLRDPIFTAKNAPTQTNCSSPPASPVHPPPRATRALLGHQLNDSGEDFDFDITDIPSSDEDHHPQPHPQPQHQCRVQRGPTIQQPAVPTTTVAPASSTTSTGSRIAAHDINHFFDRAAKNSVGKTICKFCRYVNPIFVRDLLIRITIIQRET